MPTLQPLSERLFGRGLLGSTGGEQAQGGCASHGQRGHNVVTIGSKPSRNIKWHGKTGFSDTTLGRDSQDSILGSIQSDRGEGVELHGIRRTQHVTVEFEKASIC